ncbi:probable UDP-sugar transporter protein SLC35A4 [Aplysia californica]|uniref:Probable UDP-sugar transporter protein SLC35A4 n=1 Tax=Aplysia californica TaxID=6500 RepID=A0ABM0JCE1_APLCA|nr:probable UDP-sugar transporter protein SLC35A4 [Aplysia californica]
MTTTLQLGLPARREHFKLENLVKNSYIWPVVLISEVLVYSSYSIFLNLSRIDGILVYQSSSLVLSIETVKFFFAFVMAFPEISTNGLSRVRLKNILPFAVPAVCYCVTNNLAVYMQDQMDPATFQMLCNLKIASTALLYRMIMKRRLRNLQWISLGLLMFAGMLNGYTGLSKETVSLKEIHITVLGLVMALLYCTISGFSGVYTEYILKHDSKISLPLQNCFLYIFGIILNFLLWHWQADKNLKFFHGFTHFTWAVVLCQALNGLVMSLIMKHSNNMVRLFIISSAIPVTTVLSMLIFGLQPDTAFVTVGVMVIFAIYLYNYVPKS